MILNNIASRIANKVSVEPFDNVSGIEMIAMYDLEVTLFGKSYWEKMMPYQQIQKAVQEWADANDAVIYEAPKEEFHLGYAAELAINEGKKRAVVNDLS